MNPTVLVLLQSALAVSPASAETTQTVSRIDAISRHFQRQGTIREILLGGLVAVAIVLLAVLLQAIEKRRRPTDVDRPAKLFRRLLSRLNLTVPQRDILRRMASDLGLENASVLLISRRLFETQARLWLKNTPLAVPDADGRLAELAGVLYPAKPQDGAISTNKGSPPLPDDTAPSNTPA